MATLEKNRLAARALKPVLAFAVAIAIVGMCFSGAFCATDEQFGSLFLQPETGAGDGLPPRSELVPESQYDNSDLPDYEADAYILIDRRTGTTIASKNALDRLYPASTTKIMTALLALEMGSADDMFTASAAAIRDVGDDGSNIGMIAGEAMSLGDLLNALMVKSANEAANIIAEGLCGERQAFIDLMNSKAADLGARDTHFVNASGYHDDSHYTTAFDMALFANSAMDQAAFRDIVSQRTVNLAPTNKHAEWERMWTTNNLLIGQQDDEYTIIGVKTGFTTPAGYCLVAAATHDASGMELLCVVLGVRGESASAKRFDITAALLDYGFSQFATQSFVEGNELIETVSVIGGESSGTVGAVASGSIKLFLPTDRERWNVSRIMHVQAEVVAPVAKGEKLGYIEYRQDGRFAGQVNVVAASDVAAADGGPHSLPERRDSGAARDESKLMSSQAIRPPAAIGGPSDGDASEGGDGDGNGAGEAGGVGASGGVAESGAVAVDGTGAGDAGGVGGDGNGSSEAGGVGGDGNGTGDAGDRVGDNAADPAGSVGASGGVAESGAVAVDGTGAGDVEGANDGVGANDGAGANDGGKAGPTLLSILAAIGKGALVAVAAFALVISIVRTVNLERKRRMRSLRVQRIADRNRRYG